jgi:hypothetical protein
MSFNERDMWENQVQVLAKHCQRMTRKIESVGPGFEPQLTHHL